MPQINYFRFPFNLYMGGKKYDTLCPGKSFIRSLCKENTKNVRVIERNYIDQDTYVVYDTPFLLTLTAARAMAEAYAIDQKCKKVCDISEFIEILQEAEKQALQTKADE